MFDLEAAYKELKEKYVVYMKDEASREKYCPTKRVDVMARNSDGVAVRCYNFMSACIGGEYCTKKILIDDRTGEVSECVRYGMSGLDIKLTGANITPIRCGLMTCLAIDLLTKKRPFSVGYIGNGRINLANCKAISAILGNHVAVIRGSNKDRGKNKDKFEEIATAVAVDDTLDLSLLNSCDVVISCTSTGAREDVLANAALKDVPLVIALDSGYLFGESFRKERRCFTDHKEQLEAHYDDEFPYDKERHAHENLQLIKPDEPIFVSLFGVAIADLVTAKHYIKEKVGERIYVH